MKMNHASCSNNWVLHLNLSKQQDVTGQDELQSMPPASSAVLQVVDLKATRTRPSSCASPQQQPTLQFSGPAACRNSTPAAAHLPAFTGYCCCCTESRAQRSDLLPKRRPDMKITKWPAAALASNEDCHDYSPSRTQKHPKMLAFSFLCRQDRGQGLQLASLDEITQKDDPRNDPLQYRPLAASA